MSRNVLVAALLAATAACSPSPSSTPAPAPVSAPAATSPAEPKIVLPVSLNEVMVALVDHASEPLWLDSYEAPKNDSRWLDVKYNAYQIAISGKLIQLAGTGPNDERWIADPEWRIMADEMSSSGLQALRAAEAKDVTALNAAGDRLVASCESCHKKFKPGLTTMGVYKSPNYPPKP